MTQVRNDCGSERIEVAGDEKYSDSDVLQVELVGCWEVEWVGSEGGVAKGRQVFSLRSWEGGRSSDDSGVWPCTFLCVHEILRARAWEWSCWVMGRPTFHFPMRWYLFLLLLSVHVHLTTLLILFPHFLFLGSKSGQRRISSTSLVSREVQAIWEDTRRGVPEITVQWGVSSRPARNVPEVPGEWDSRRGLDRSVEKVFTFQLRCHDTPTTAATVNKQQNVTGAGEGSAECWQECPLVSLMGV